ncbi:hypothetical protein [Peredibacter starrii]|uniref:Uncharacterized protein n=1 Tax=Peredibacter starrii TaxID=28202 RepID=A0AAX4HTS1_9BACT|nr:hypothetical protein [Peredibacter starrii]WPU66597.1 hypothetical protein SOO65_07550 [Peredibacter starrii]
MITTLLLASTVIVTKPVPKDPELTCKTMEEIKFDRPGVYKKKVKVEVVEFNYDWARLGDYVVWNGEDVPNKIINTKKKTECEIEYPNVRSIKKFKDYDLLFVDAFRDKLEYTAVIKLEDCKKIWELEIKTEASEVTLNSTMAVKTNAIKGSDLDKCQSCWNEKTEACRNLPVTTK